MIKGRNYTPEGYESSKTDLAPHGLAVTITAPEVFKFTASACPDRHLKGAEALGADIRGIKKADAGAFTSGKTILVLQIFYFRKNFDLSSSWKHSN